MSDVDVRGSLQLLLPQNRFQRGRRRLAAIDQPDLRPHDFLQQRLQQWVMGAAQHQRADASLTKLLEILGGDQCCCWMFEPPFFYQRNEQWAGALEDGDARSQRIDRTTVGIARNRSRGSDHADWSGSPGRDRCSRARLDDAENGDIGRLLQRSQRMRGAGIAGNYHGLDTLTQQPVQDLQAVSGDRLRRLGTVGHSGSVAEVNSRLLGQALIDRSRDSQPPDSGVEDPDWSLIHGVWTGMETAAPTPPGRASIRRSPGKSARWAET